MTDLSTKEIREMMEHPHSTSTMRDDVCGIDREDIKAAVKMTTAVVGAALFVAMLLGMFECGRRFQRNHDYNRFIEHQGSIIND